MPDLTSDVDTIMLLRSQLERAEAEVARLTAIIRQMRDLCDSPTGARDPIVVRRQNLRDLLTTDEPREADK